MVVLRKILALLFWIGSACGVISLFNTPSQQVPYTLFSIILWFYWGYVLWKNDRRTVVINPYLYSLLVIAVFVAEFVVCLIIGSIISGIVSNYNQELVGWIFGVLMTFCLIKLAPSKILPKRFFVDKDVEEKNDSTANTAQQDVPSEASSERILLKDFPASDHSRYIPNCEQDMKDVTREDSTEKE